MPPISIPWSSPDHLLFARWCVLPFLPTANCLRQHPPCLSEDFDTFFFHCLVWNRTFEGKSTNNWKLKSDGQLMVKIFDSKASDWFWWLQQLLILILMPILIIFSSFGNLQLSNFRTRLPNCGTVRVGTAWQPVSPPKWLPFLAGVHRVTSTCVVWVGYCVVLLFQIFCLIPNEPDYPLMWPYFDFDLLRWVTLVQFTVRSFRQTVLAWTQHGCVWPSDEPET